MSELVVIFRAGSIIEVSVVQALLDSHGIESVRTAGPPASLFPFTVNPMGETRVSVREEEAEEAIRVIDSHREQVGGGLVVPLPQQFAALETRIGYRFRDRGMLEHALTHKSKAHEDPSGGVLDNESLEFLGDAVLGLVIADALCRTFPASSEGQKSKIKAMIVSTASLAEMAERLDLGEHMILGRGEEKTGGRRKQALLADTCEALFAAIYLDGGLEPVRQFILREMGEAVEQAGRPDYFGRDHKSRLQEALQGLGRPLPHYRVAGEVGPEHRKMFHVEVRVAGEVLAQGVGRTKKDAEQEAAKAALEELRTKNEERRTAAKNEELRTKSGETGTKNEEPSTEPTLANGPQPERPASRSEDQDPPAPDERGE
jgi:ribonuclease-3